MSYKRFLRVMPALVLGMLVCASSAQAQETYRVIVNVANPIDELTKPEAARLFLTRTTWDNGEPAYPGDLTPTSPVRAEFSREVLGVTAAGAIQHWKRVAAGQPPPSVATDREVLAFVRLKRGAIGYVSSAAGMQGVKVIQIVKAQRGS